MDGSQNQIAYVANIIVVILAAILIVIAIVRRANTTLKLSRKKKSAAANPTAIGLVRKGAANPVIAVPPPSPGVAWAPTDMSQWPISAAPFDFRSVLRVAKRDLYGTKDVQDAICASYVWMADQMGHILLGLAPTLLFCWAWPTVYERFTDEKASSSSTAHVVSAPSYGYVAVTLIVWLYWVYKEYQDFRDSQLNWANAKSAFAFDRADLIWNVKTALIFFGTGGLIAASAFLGGIAYLAICIIVMAIVDVLVVYWWLKRKMAFQQAGLPFLFRLANSSATFKSQGGANAIVAISSAPGAPPDPASQHILVTGLPGSGRTSMACGVGTEFAFQLGIVRYLSLVDLVEKARSGPVPPRYLDWDDGRLLWPLSACNLLIIDDIDAVEPPSKPPKLPITSVTTPAALTAVLGGPGSLQWLADKRTMWVIGDSASSTTAWTSAISGLLTPAGRPAIAVTAVHI